MKVIENFLPDTERYLFDFKLCTFKKGYAQIDTDQDAWYYGNWANPEQLIIVSYIEGDLYTSIADNKKEFIAEIRKMEKWNKEQGYTKFRIDPGLNPQLAGKFKALGLEDLLH